MLIDAIIVSAILRSISDMLVDACAVCTHSCRTRTTYFASLVKHSVRVGLVLTKK